MSRDSSSVDVHTHCDLEKKELSFKATNFEATAEDVGIAICFLYEAMEEFVRERIVTKDFKHLTLSQYVFKVQEITGFKKTSETISEKEI